MKVWPLVPAHHMSRFGFDLRVCVCVCVCVRMLNRGHPWGHGRCVGDGAHFCAANGCVLLGVRDIEEDGIAVVLALPTLRESLTRCMYNRACTTPTTLAIDHWCTSLLERAVSSCRQCSSCLRR